MLVSSFGAATGIGKNRARAVNDVLLGVSLILVDEIGSCRDHDLGLLRLSAAKSRDRLAKLGIRSKQVDRFVNALWLIPKLKRTFKNTRLESVELMVLALKLLSRIASRYGRCGRRVFEANQYPMVRAMQLFECMPFLDGPAQITKTCIKQIALGLVREYIHII
jgi:hypothetical protein